MVAGGHRSHLAAGEEQEGEDAAAATDPPTHPAEQESDYRFSLLTIRITDM